MVGDDLSLRQLWDLSSKQFQTFDEYTRTLLYRLIEAVEGGVEDEVGLIRPGMSATEINQALANSSYVAFGSGEYDLSSGLTIPGDGDSITAPRKVVEAKGNINISVPSGVNGINVIKRRYVTLDGLRFISDGTKGDGLDAVGIRFAGNNARFRVDNCLTHGFSGAGMRFIQCLAGKVFDPQILNCTHGIAAVKSGSVVPTSLSVYDGYISECTRGFFGENLVGGQLWGTVFEESGSAATEDGAIHLTAGSRGIKGKVYMEANNRNIVAIDAEGSIDLNSTFVVTPPAADVNTWSGVASGLRGNHNLKGNTLKVRYLSPIDGFDLEVGDLKVPAAWTAGAKTSTYVGRWGPLPPPDDIVSFGPTTSGAFTTIKTFAAGEFSGLGALTGGQNRVAYLVFLFVGETDRSKFSGLYVVDGITGIAGNATPTVTKLAGATETANIQMSGLDLQINVTDAANNYGRRGKALFWKIGPLG